MSFNLADPAYFAIYIKFANIPSTLGHFYAFLMQPNSSCVQHYHTASPFIVYITLYTSMAVIKQSFSDKKTCLK